MKSDAKARPPDRPVTSKFGRGASWRPPERRFSFVFLGIVQAVGVLWVVLMVLMMYIQARMGMSGGEIAFLYMHATLIPLLGIIALINLLGLPVYVFRRKLQGRSLRYAIASLVLSVPIAVYGAYAAYQVQGGL